MNVTSECERSSLRVRHMCFFSAHVVLPDQDVLVLHPKRVYRLHQEDRTLCVPPWGDFFRFGACYLLDRVVVFGHYGTHDDQFHVWHSFDEGLSWKRVVAEGIYCTEGRFIHFTHCVDPVNKVIHIMGGINDDGEWLSHHVTSSTGGMTWWQTIHRREYTPRAYASSVCFADGSIAIMAGERTTRMNDVWVSHTVPSGRDGRSLVPTWTCVCPQAPWTPRVMAHAVVIPHEHVLLIGGMDGDGLLNDVWISEDRCRTWALLCPNAPWIPRVLFASSINNDKRLIITGGMRIDGDKCCVRFMDERWFVSWDASTWMRHPTTELHWEAACASSRVENILSLIQQGHSIFDVDSNGKRPSDVATSIRVRSVLLQMESFPYSDAQLFMCRVCEHEEPLVSALVTQAFMIPRALATTRLILRTFGEKIRPMRLVRIACKRGLTDIAIRTTARMVRMRWAPDDAETFQTDCAPIVLAGYAELCTTCPFSC